MVGNIYWLNNLRSNFLNLEMDSSKNFSCEICEKTFSTNKCKDKHINIVHGEVKNFECNICSKSFGEKKQFILHIETNHNTKEKEITNVILVENPLLNWEI